MDTRLGKGLVGAIGLSALLALGACGDRGSEGGAERAVRNDTGIEQSQSPGQASDAAARAAAQRSGATELSQGSGT